MKKKYLKTISFVLIVCVALCLNILPVSAKTNSCTLKTKSNQVVNCSLSAKKSCIFATSYSTSKTTLNQSKTVTAKCVLKNGSKTKTQSVVYTYTRTAATVSMYLYPSAFKNGSYIGSYYTGTCKCKFSALKVPETSSTSKTIEASVS